MVGEKWKRELENPLIRRFYLLVSLWILSILILLTKNFNTVGAAVIAAGPPLLYYFYKEIVSQPVLELTNKDGFQYSKFLLIGRKEDSLLIVYPVIHVFVTLENKGKATAYDCFARIKTNVGNPFARWGGGLNEETVDIHPGSFQRLVIMRFYPELSSEFEKDMENLNKKLESKDAKYRVTSPTTFRVLGDAGKVQMEKMNICVQRVRRQAQEERLLKRTGGGEPDVFWGAYLDPKKEYNISLEMGAENWRGTIDLGKISLKKALEEAEWQENVKDEQYKPLRKLLDKYGWKNKQK